MAEDRAPLHLFERAVTDFYEADDYRQLDGLIETLCSYGSISRGRKAMLRETPAMVRAARQSDFDAATWLLPRLFIELEGILRDYVRADLGQVAAATDNPVKIGIKSLRGHAMKLERPALHVLSDHLFRNTRRRVARHKRISRNLHLHGLTKVRPTFASAIRVLLLIELTANLIDRRRGVDPTGSLAGRTFWVGLLGQATKTSRRLQGVMSIGADSSGPRSSSPHEESSDLPTFIDRRDQAVNAAIERLMVIP
jgi:hypothetical protein